MADERSDRVARNESVFRDVNEGIEAGHRDAGANPVAFICECGALGCNQLIELTLAEYEAVRADPHRFAMVPGHEIPDVETVVERREGYFIAEKHPETHPIVERSDPRS
jgi:hypothetical protein